MNRLSVKSLLVAAALTASVGAAPARAETVTLRYSNWLPVTHHLVQQLMLPWAADVEKVTEGRVKVEMLPKVVGTVTGQIDALTDGLADLSLFVPGYSPGRFPLVEGLELPFLGNDPVKRSVATWNAYEKYIAGTDTFAGVHVVSIFSSNSSHPMTTKAPLMSVDSYKGLKIRTPSPAATEALNLLGAVPVSKPMPELYELAQGGVVDGGVLPIDTVQAFKLETVFKHYTIIAGGMTNVQIVVAMSEDKWNAISPEDRKAIDAISGAVFAAKNGQILQSKMDSAIGALKEAGVTFVDMSAEETAKMREILKPIRENWVKKAKEHGLPNPEDMIRDLAAETGATL